MQALYASRMKKVKYDISFIHTGQVHIEKFGSLVAELSPNLLINHIVDESLLTHAQQFGVDSILKSNLLAQLEALSLVSKVIVITCSSIGGIAEEIDNLNGCKVQRVDQAMADFAVENGNNILVLAALESTLEPTRELLLKSLAKHNSKSKLTLCRVENAWDYFLAGKMEQYYDQISVVITSNETKYDLIVLAQASMSEVQNNVNVSIPVISSPRLGVERAIKALTI